MTFSSQKMLLLQKCWHICTDRSVAVSNAHVGLQTLSTGKSGFISAVIDAMLFHIVSLHCQEMFL